MNGLMIGALVALGAMQQTDTTFALDGAERLEVEALGGSIRVDTWDREEIRVRADHSTRTFVVVERRRGTVQVESEARRGPANIVDFHITVPRALALALEGQYGDVIVEGSDGAVEVETLRGEVTIRGGRGDVRVANTVGNVLVEGASGRIDVESTAGDVRIVSSSGEILAESTGGAVVLENVSASSVDVGSVGGRVHYAGTFQAGGTYFFGAHGGSITIVVPEGTSATLRLASLHGSITSNLGGEVQSYRSGERHQIDVGGGGALVEAETYGGRIRIVRAGTEGSEPPPAGRGAAGAGSGRWEARGVDAARAPAPGLPRDRMRAVLLEPTADVAPWLAVHALPAVRQAVHAALETHLEGRLDVASATIAR